MIIDMHIHCHELREEELAKYAEGYVLVCVSDDPVSSEKTMDLPSRHGNVEPCVGIHPWNITHYTINDLRRVIEVAVDRGVKCIGEVGLDKVFVPDSFKAQLEFYREAVNYAREYGLILNIHAAGAWREAFKEAYRRDIERAYFHWYTGPLDLLGEIVDAGYYVGLNPAWTIQVKHRDIISRAPLENIITESDAPYEYRGLKLMPDMIAKSLELLASIHNMSVKEIEARIRDNYSRISR